MSLSPLSRRQCQVLRFDLPRLTPEEASGALDYKLRAAYPGYAADLPFYTYWFTHGKGLGVIVVIPQRESQDQEWPLDLNTQFPLLAPLYRSQDLLLTVLSSTGREIHIYREGILSQSHFLPPTSETFFPLVASLRDSHPGMEWRHCTGSGLSPWPGPDHPQPLGSQDLGFPRLTFRGSPLRSHRGTIIRSLAALVLMGGLLAWTGQHFSRQKETLAQLQQEVAALEALTQPTKPGEDRKALEARLKDLESQRGYPLGEVLNRIALGQNQGFRLTGLSFKEGRLRLEGRSQNAVRTLEGLRTDPWFQDLTPSSLRRDDRQGGETFVFEGRVNFDQP